MKWTACVAVATLTAASLSAGAAPAGKSLAENSPDVLAPVQLKRKVAEKAALPLVLSPTLLAAAAPTVEDVGDADSFGRNVTYSPLSESLLR